MNIDVFTIVRNEEFMMPYFLRHYSTFARKIYIIDDGSTDNTRKIAEGCEKAVMCDLDTGGLDDQYMAKLYSLVPRKISSDADWVICVDVDELIWAKDPSCWDRAKSLGFSIMIPKGWQMISSVLPSNGGQIYEEITEGVRDPMLDKPCIWRPSVSLEYTHGRHGCKTDGVQAEVFNIKLLHFRFLSRGYVIERHSRNWQRMSLNNKAVGSGIHNSPDWTGYQSLDWYEQALKEKKPCLD